eukprot:7060810-Alexandrium_andersonii.AAC.1
MAVLQQDSAPSADLDTVVRECSLDDAVDMYNATRLRHIPGMSNIIADALPRQRAPEPKTCPTALASVPRALVPA